MKAVISNRIYIEVDKVLQGILRETLTYKVPTYGDGPPLIINNYATFREGIMSLPCGRSDLIPESYEVVDKRIRAPVEFPKFRGELRESQQAIYDQIDDNCLINAKVGWGKTFMALAAAAKLGQKTLVVVHTIPLMNQWVKEVEKCFGFTPGRIGDGKENWSAPITIGNVASLYTRMDKLAKVFGTIIMDEVHHAPSPTFTRIIDRSYARYKIGLSGTLQRKDGLHVLLPDYFGFKVYKPPRENTLDPTIHAYNTNIMFPYGEVWAHRVNALKESFCYQDWILDRMQHYEKLGHKVLLVSDRVEFLRVMAEKSGGALTIGETEDRDAEIAKIYSGEATTISGTLSIWKEGISCNPLSCLILGTPINNDPMLEQVIGRIQRLYEGKLPPVVVDPILRGRTTERQFMNRCGFYMREGFPIEYL